MPRLQRVTAGNHINKFRIHVHGTNIQGKDRYVAYSLKKVSDKEIEFSKKKKKISKAFHFKDK